MPSVKKRIGLLTDDDTRKWAMQAAFKERRSLAALASVALLEYLERNYPDLNPDKNSFITLEESVSNGFL